MTQLTRIAYNHKAIIKNITERTVEFCIVPKRRGMFINELEKAGFCIIDEDANWVEVEDIE